MTIKSTLIYIYLILGILTCMYGKFWGDYSFRGFWYNLGMGTVWPAVWFPAFGKFIGGAIMLIIVGYYALTSR